MTQNQQQTEQERAHLVRAQERAEVAALLPQEFQRSMLWNPLLLTQAQQAAKIFQRSGMLPEVGPKGQRRPMPIESILVGLDIARRAGLEPLAVLQSIYFVHGRAGWSSSFLIERARAGGYPLRWRFVKGEGKADGIERWECTCYSPELEDEDTASGFAEVELTTEQATGQGWHKGSDSWRYDPKLMLRYRTATQWVRLYQPGIILNLGGMHSAEELATMEVVEEVELLPEPDESHAPTLAEALKVAEPDEQWHDPWHDPLSGQVYDVHHPTPEPEVPAKRTEPEPENLELDKFRMQLRNEEHAGPTIDATDPRPDLRTQIDDLKRTLTEVQVAAAHEAADVKVLRKDSPIDRYQSLLSALEYQLELKEVETLQEKAKPTELPPEPEPKADATVAEVKQLVGQLGREDVEAACSAAMVPFNYEAGTPIWGGLKGEKLNRLRDAAHALAQG